MPLNPPDIDRLRELFDYDPDEGLLTWRTKRSNRVKAGDEAGVFHERKKQVIVTVDGQKLRATDIIHALVTGQHTRPHDMVLYNGAHDDLRLSNLRIELRPSTYHTRLPRDGDPEDAMMLDMARDRRRSYMKRYYAKKKAAKDALAEERRKRTKTIPGVTWSPLRNRWVVEQKPEISLNIHHPYMLGDFPTAEQAEAALFAFRAGVAFVRANKPPTPLTPADLERQRTTTAGHNGVNFEEAHTIWAYDPQTGFFYHRKGALPGLRADKTAPTGKLLRLTHAGWTYPAHFMAWFMTHGEWPPRHGLRWRDGNPANNAIANLRKRDEL